MAETSATPHLFADMLARVHAVCADLAKQGGWPEGIDFSRVVVEPPREASHGDMATNAAMVLAKEAKSKPRDLADKIATRLAADPLVTKVDVAGPGFINLTLKAEAWTDALRTVLAEGEAYGRTAPRGGAKVNVEYVSANPTGPMHVGHCRGAVFGDALANLLAFGGRDVTREYYINDAGAQVDVLGRSAFLRYREALGEQISIPEGLYPGDYLKPVGQALAAEHGDRLLQLSEAEWLPIARDKAIAMMMEMIKADLAALKGHPILIAGSSRTTFWPWLRAKYGYTDDQIRPYTFNLQPFFADKTVAQQAYPSSEPYQADQQHEKFKFFLLADGGYPPYGSTIVTTEKMIAEKPDVVARFVKASLEGWYDYMKNPAPGNALIKADNPKMTDGQLAFALERMKEMKAIDRGDAATLGVGIITADRYRQIYDFLVAGGLLDPKVDWQKSFDDRFVRNLKIGLK